MRSRCGCHASTCHHLHARTVITAQAAQLGADTYACMRTRFPLMMLSCETSMPAMLHVPVILVPGCTYLPIWVNL